MKTQRDTTAQGWILFVASALVWLVVGQSAVLLALGLMYLAPTWVFLAAGLASWLGW